MKNIHKRIKLNNLLARIVVCLLSLFSLSFVFPAGMINSNSQKSICSSFFTTLTSKHTIGKTYSAMIVEPKDGSTKQLNDTVLEFYKLYGSFRQDKACFASTINVNKESNVKLETTTIDNLSLLFTTSGIQLQYVQNVGWRHEFYPINMMYNAPKEERPLSNRFCFISQTQADALLNAGLGGESVSAPYTISDYKKLQYRNIDLICNEDIASYCILSVFYETGAYINALNEIMGNFVFIFGKEPANLKKQATFFMRDYDFQNEYYIDYAKGEYDIKDFDYKVGKYNVIDDFADKENISKLIFTNINDTPSILIIIFSMFLLFLSLFFVCFTKFGNLWFDYFLIGTSLFLPYGVFKLIAYVTQSVRLFTSLSTQINMIAIIVYIVCFVCIVVFKKAVSKKC